MKEKSKIFIAGHKGMVGSAIHRKLLEMGYENIIVKTRLELNLLDIYSVNQFFENEKPEFVFLCAAKVGGIYANNIYRADFLYENLQIQNNIIHSSYIHSVKKLLFLGSSCIYPKLAPQPLKEESFLTGLLEPTNEPYAIAKIAGIKLCEAYRDQYGCNFISAMPTNLYGINDNYHPENSHVFAALVKKIVDAKLNNASFIEIWGTGSPRREFLCSDDLADALVFLMNYYDSKDIINIGTGEDISIIDLVKLMTKVLKYNGEIKFDVTKPDGTPRKLLDVSKLNNIGWNHSINLQDGIKIAYNDYKNRNLVL